ncbi:hypothetical protein LCGC14_3023920, partial [marine sediment metagenome]
DRQDLDKRYINLLCVEPHITFPPCNGSLKLTEYGFDVSYEDETDCADINETCTIIDKFISKRPEAGDPGGLPDVPIPEPVEKASVTSTGEAETVAGVKYTPIAGSGAPDDSTGSKDEPVKKEEDLAPSDAPFSKKPETAATEQDEEEEEK